MTRHLWLGITLAASLGLAGATFAQDQTNRGNDTNRQGGDTSRGDLGPTGNKDAAGTTTAKIDEAQIRQVLQQKEYLKGLGITPRIEGDVVVLEGNVPTKAHAVAALLAVWELPGVKSVSSKLTFGESTVGLGGTGTTEGTIGSTRNNKDVGHKDTLGSTGTSGNKEFGNTGNGAKDYTGKNESTFGGKGLGSDSTTLGAGFGESRDLEVVVAIFPSVKGEKAAVGGTGSTGSIGGGTTVPAGVHERFSDVIIFKKGVQ